MKWVGGKNKLSLTGAKPLTHLSNCRSHLMLFQTEERQNFPPEIHTTLCWQYISPVNYLLITGYSFSQADGAPFITQIFLNTALFFMSEVFQPLSNSDFNGTSLTLFLARSEGPSPALAASPRQNCSRLSRTLADRKNSLLDLSQQKDEPSEGPKNARKILS